MSPLLLPSSETLCAGFVCVASIIAPPQEGEISAPDGAPIAAPDDHRGRGRQESQADRLQRLYRSGVRKPPPAPLKRDYLSVLKRKQQENGVLPNLPPQLHFGFGFGSWFPVAESSGRKSIPLGSHHVSAQVYSFGADRDAGRFAEYLKTAFWSLHVTAVSFSGETSIPGFDTDAFEINYSVAVDDLDVGTLLQRNWKWPAWSWGHLDLSLGMGYLPFRFRQMRQYGSAIPRDKDFSGSGFVFNSVGGQLRAAFGYTALSLFQGGIFVEAVGGFPAEARLRVGLEVALQSPLSLPPPAADASVKSAKKPPKEGTSPEAEKEKKASDAQRDDLKKDKPKKQEQEPGNQNKKKRKRAKDRGGKR